MTSRKKRDADNPEWTRDDFVAAEAPKDALPADVLSKFGKHRGPGWQARIDAVLTKIVKKEKRPASTRIRKAG
jgi:hypothetical protein